MYGNVFTRLGFGGFCEGQDGGQRFLVWQLKLSDALWGVEDELPGIVLHKELLIPEEVVRLEEGGKRCGITTRLVECKVNLLHPEVGNGHVKHPLALGMSGLK